MSFVPAPAGLPGMVYVPDGCESCRKKNDCSDCHFCQWCDDDRCRSCLACRTQVPEIQE